MRIAIVSPTFPPGICGVGDHTAKLAQALGQAGADVTVWTGERAPRSFAGFGVRAIPGLASSSGRAALGITIADDVRRRGPTAVLVQYTPLLHARRGVFPGLARWIASLRSQARGPVALLAHELNTPVELSAVGLLLGIPQWAQIRAAAYAADRMFFTWQGALDKVRALPGLRADKLMLLPVGSNIAIHASGVDDLDVPRIAYFGTAHPSHGMASLRAAIELLAERSPRAEFDLIGTRPESLPLPPHLKERAHFYPALPEAEVSERIRQASLLLSPFVDGVSTRRGSFMAAIAHGKPVVTTLGTSSSADVPWPEIASAVAADRGPAAFAEAAATLLEDSTRAQLIGQRSKEFYESHWDWPRAAQRLLDALT